MPDEVTLVGPWSINANGFRGKLSIEFKGDQPNEFVGTVTIEPGVTEQLSDISFDAKTNQLTFNRSLPGGAVQRYTSYLYNSAFPFFTNQAYGRGPPDLNRTTVMAGFFDAPEGRFGFAAVSGALPDRIWPGFWNINVNGYRGTLENMQAGGTAALSIEPGVTEQISNISFDAKTNIWTFDRNLPGGAVQRYTGFQFLSGEPLFSLTPVGDVGGIPALDVMTGFFDAPEGRFGFIAAEPRVF